MEPGQHVAEGLVMIPFQVILGLGSNLQHIQERYLWLLMLVRLPELKELLHFVAIQLHPLSAELDQGCFGVDEMLPFLFCDYLAPNRQLGLLGDYAIEAEIARIGRRCPFRRAQRRFEADLRAPTTLGCPPRGDDYSVASISKHPGALLQERESFVQSHGAPGWFV